MENYILEHDIRVVCIKTAEFPKDLPIVWQKMLMNFPPTDGQDYYGISFPESPGKIVYRAAVNESSVKDPDRQGYENFVIKKGRYISDFIEDFKKDETVIGKTFQKLLDSDKIANDGICLEIYYGQKSVRCMITHK